MVDRYNIHSSINLLEGTEVGKPYQAITVWILIILGINNSNNNITKYAPLNSNKCNLSHMTVDKTDNKTKVHYRLTQGIDRPQCLGVQMETSIIINTSTINNSIHRDLTHLANFNKIIPPHNTAKQSLIKEYQCMDLISKWFSTNRYHNIHNNSQIPHFRIL